MTPPATDPKDTKPDRSGAEPGQGEYASLLRQGQAHLKAGRFNQAIGVLNKAVQVNPAGADAMVALASAYFEMGRDGQAISMANQALQIDPNSARAHLTLGTIYQTAGRNAQAIQAYRAYLQLEPNGRSAGEVRSILKNLK
jgi:Flp pilus assembly protein TadD